MTQDRCERLWQVEAFEDRRLEPNDRASFERHIETCAECTRELREFDRLQGLMVHAPGFERSELARRRARTRLLSDASRQGAERSPARAIAMLGMAAVAAALIALLLRHPQATGFEVTDLGHAEWHSEQQGGTTRVTLRAGVAAFHVEHVASGSRFLVSLPDGEIEVHGTRFVVDIADARTRSIAVSEGVVALRLAGGERMLVSGQHWVAETPVAPPPAAPELAQAAPIASPSAVSPSAVSPSAASPSAASPSAASPSAASSQVATASMGVPVPVRDAVAQRALQAATTANPVVASQTSSGVASAVAPTPAVVSESAGARFSAAVAAFSAGDYGHADALLAAFVRDFPRDARAEDAAFLRADARARRGDRSGAAAAAREYLARYQHGLRAPEAERLSHLAD